MMLIDSHAHLDYEYDEPLDVLLKNAKDAGIGQILAIAAAVDSLDAVCAIAEKYPHIFFTTGIHPHDSKDFSAEIFEKIKALHLHPKCRAVGELGLDYHYDLSDRKVQHEALQTQLDFSAQIGKPVVVHTREADDDTISFLSAHSSAFAKNHPGKPPGVIHCFTGNARLAEECLRMGYFISFSGIITFKNAGDLRDVVKNTVPLERILVETDSPFLAPIPHRGKKNQPAYTKFVAEKVAELKGVPLDEVARITTENSRNLFQLPKA